MVLAHFSYIEAMRLRSGLLKSRPGDLAAEGCSPVFHQTSKKHLLPQAADKHF
jgi:hypothetical protein